MPIGDGQLAGAVRGAQPGVTMARLLYLVHRIPFPPDKGDKVRSYHVLKHLLERHQVHLGTFIDDPADEAHVPTLRAMCADLHVARLQPRRARLASLAGLASGQALTLRYYRDAGLARWVAHTLATQPIDAAIVFSSSMAQYAVGHAGLAALVDFVDVDSAKWTEYAERHPWPLSWLYRREGRLLLAYERKVAAASARSFFVTANETELFRRLAPECGPRLEPMCNGVDAGFFAPDPQRVSPFEPGELPLVFTGAMDYWPNVDAVSWFVADMLPELRRRHPRVRFHIVGRNPTPAVRALAGPAVNVTGTVADVRPYLQHAAVRRCTAARWRAASRTRCSKPWRWPVRSSPRASCAAGHRRASVGPELRAAPRPCDALHPPRSTELLRRPATTAATRRVPARQQRAAAPTAGQAHLSAFDRHLAAAPSSPAATGHGQVVSKLPRHECHSPADLKPNLGRAECAHAALLSLGQPRAGARDPAAGLPRHRHRDGPGKSGGAPRPSRMRLLVVPISLWLIWRRRELPGRRSQPATGSHCGCCR
jgi:sugar transferase (PEP-CTERM/EpsH1 system associated)